MQVIGQLLLLLGVAQATSVAAPIGKVLELMSNIEAAIVQETEEAAKLKAEKDTWCKDTAVNLGFEITTGTSDVADLEAKIAKEAAAISSLTEKIEELAGQIAKDDKDLQAATKIRAEEVGDFEAEEKELVATIDTLQRAIGVLEKELAKSGGAALVQVQSASTVVQALEVMVQAAMFSQADASRLTAFVQSAHQSSDGDAGAPDAAVYESKSGSIVDVLSDLLDKAESSLSDARAKESNAQHAFELLKQSLEDSIAFGTKDMEAAKTSMAKAGEEKSAAEGSLADVSKDLAEDKTMLEDVKKDCASYAEEYEASAKSRAEELAAVKKAKAIIEETTGGAAAIALPQTSAPSFLQVRRDRRSAHDSASAIRFVRELARKRKSPALAQLVSHLASAVRQGARDGEDPFEKVRGLITEMIAKLEKEASEDAEKKAYCDKEMKDAEAKKSEKSDTVETLTTKIDQMAANSAKLKDSVATLEKELAELAATQSAMDKMRKEESELFAEQDKSLKDGITGVEAALKILKEYYATEDKAHDAKDGAAGGIIAMLEVCLSDFTKSLADITAAEDSAQSDYEVTTQDNKEAKVAKEQSVKYETKEAAELDKAISEATAERATTQSELDAVLEYLEKLKDMCIAKPETYADRADRRAAEIEGLKKALEILG
jgi:chromosome segregation ATPase